MYFKVVITKGFKCFKCENEFKLSLESTYGSLSSACAKQFGSKYTSEGVRYKY